MIAVRVLDAFEDCELAPRAHMDLELADAVDEVVVDTFSVLTVALAARLPVAFEDVPRVLRVRGELLRRDRLRDRERRGRREHTGEKPGMPGEQLTHDAPFPCGP